MNEAQELLELSIMSDPMNEQAVQKLFKNYETSIVEELFETLEKSKASYVMQKLCSMKILMKELEYLKTK